MRSWIIDAVEKAKRDQGHGKLDQEWIQVPEVEHIRPISNTKVPTIEEERKGPIIIDLW